MNVWEQQAQRQREQEQQASGQGRERKNPVKEAQRKHRERKGAKWEKQYQKTAKKVRANEERQDKLTRQDLMNQLASFDAGKGIEYLQSSMERASDKGSDFETAMDVANRGYAKMSMLIVTQPIFDRQLRGEELTGDDVKAVLGRGMAFYLLDPEFRQSVNSAITKYVYPAVRKDAISAAPGTKAAEARDRIEHRTGKRLPLNIKSASMLYLGLNKSAYEEMRAPDANVEEIQKRLSENLKRLTEIAEADGISEERLNQGVRMTYGRLCKEDPSLECIFSETAYSKVGRAPGKEGHAYLRDASVWSGEYASYAETDSRAPGARAHGEDYTGRFTVRTPMVHDDRVDMIDDHLRRGFAACRSCDDLKIVFAKPLEWSDKWENMSDEERKHFGWVNGWRARGDRLMQMAMDDCWTNEERDAVEREWSEETSSCMQDWMDQHPDQVDEVLNSDWFSSDEEEIDEEELFRDAPRTDKDDPDFAEYWAAQAKQQEQPEEAPNGSPELPEGTISSEELKRRRDRLQQYDYPEGEEPEREHPGK